MFMVIVCEKFGWTYYEYLEQPTFFVDLIREKMSIDAQKQKSQKK